MALLHLVWLAFQHTQEKNLFPGSTRDVVGTMIKFTLTCNLTLITGFLRLCEASTLCVGGLQCLFENFKVCLYCMHYVKASTAGYEICKFSGNTSYLFCFMLTLLLITSKLTLECIRSATDM